MDQARFDAITRMFGNRSLSRRTALAGGAAMLAASSAISATSRASAQEASPLSSPFEDAENTGGPTMMFVQSYASGSVARIDGRENRYTLTLQQGHGQTIYFSDRPDRIVGSTPTDQFLEGLGFHEDNPPNAALVVETAPGETDVAVVELFNPIFDPENSGVTYDIEVLGNWQQSLEMEFTEPPTDLAELTPSFGSAELFIDDCADRPVVCHTNAGTQYKGSLGVQDHCYWWGIAMCVPCEPKDARVYRDVTKYWGDRCNETFPDCNGSCGASSGLP